MVLKVPGLQAVVRRFARKRLEIPGERATSFGNLAAQVMGLIRAELEEMDPDGWHWLQDLYVDGEDLFAVTVSGGRLYRWPISVDGTAVTIGDPAIVEVEFTESEVQSPESRVRSRSMVRQAADGSWFGVSVMCTATVNKLGILDSRQLFDSFVERFTGKSEYINILHLGGASSKIGEVRHIFRDDKLLVGFYTFTKDDPIAEAAARTLAGDSDGEWGGSIEFLHYGALEKVTVAEGIELPVTKDGKFLGYSFAKSADCAAWHTGNLVQERMAMTEKDKKIARQLLGSDELVEELAKRLGATNRTLEGAVTYTVVRSASAESGVRNAESRASAGDASEGEFPLGAAAVTEEQTPVDGQEITYELDEEAIGQLSGQVIERAGLGRYDQVLEQVQRQVEGLGQRIEELAGLLNGQAEALQKRLAVLEQEEQVRYQEYDASKPRQPVIKVGVRPRDTTNGTDGANKPAIDVRQESAFAQRARAQRSKS